MFNLPCCIFVQQRKRSDHHGHDWQDPALNSRRNKSEREIARITGLSRNTVAKWLHGEVDGAPKYRRGEQPNKLTVFHEALKRALKADARRPKHERRTAKALYAEIKAAGYAGGYTRVTDFIRAWRQAEGQAATTNAFIPLAFELGEAFQFDWSEEGLVVGGIYYRAQVSHMKLCASRAFWLVAYPSQGHEMLFDAHTRSFAALGRLARSERVRLARGYLEVAGAVDGEGRRGGRWRACVRGVFACIGQRLPSNRVASQRRNAYARRRRSTRHSRRQANVVAWSCTPRSTVDLLVSLSMHFLRQKDTSSSSSAPMPRRCRSHSTDSHP